MPTRAIRKFREFITSHKVLRESLVFFLLCAPVSLVIYFVVISIDGEPYVMTLNHTANNNIIRFYQRDRNLVSEDIIVKKITNKDEQVEFDRYDKKSNVFTVDFIDISPLPGCVRMRIGELNIDVNEEFLTINGKKHVWIKYD